MHLLYIGVLLLVIVVPGLSACHAQKNPAADTATVVVKDRSQYSHTFLSNLRTFTYSSHYQLKDSLLIIGQLDTAYFPTELPLRKEQVFTGSKSNRQFELRVTRINYTTINYTLRVNNAGHLNEYKGLADISAGFFLGAETVEDDHTGTAYLANEYYSHAKNCDLSIRIGGEDKLYAKVIVNCGNKVEDIDLEDCPTLRVQ